MSTEPMHKITVKIGDSLRTIQADTHEEFVEQLELAHDSLQQCYEIMMAAKAVGTIVQTSNETPTFAPHATSAAPAAPAAFTDATVPQCPHGAMTPRSGSGAKGPWKAWFCPTPKGTPDQCKPQFLNRSTPEWNNFPA